MGTKKTLNYNKTHAHADTHRTMCYPPHRRNACLVAQVGLLRAQPGVWMWTTSFYPAETWVGTLCVCVYVRVSVWVSLWPFLCLTDTSNSHDVLKMFFVLLLLLLLFLMLLFIIFCPALDITPPSLFSPPFLLPSWLQPLVPPFFCFGSTSSHFFPLPVQFNLFFFPPSLREADLTSSLSQFQFCSLPSSPLMFVFWICVTFYLRKHHQQQQKQISHLTLCVFLSGLIADFCQFFLC